MPTYFNDPNEPEPGPSDPNDPRVQDFQRGEALRQGAMNAKSVSDWINLLRSIPNPSPGEAQLLKEIEANPGGYEAGRQGSGGALRKKSPLDFVGNHPWLTVGAFLAGAAAPALLGGGGAAGATGATTGGTTMAGMTGSVAAPTFGAAAPTLGSIAAPTFGAAAPTIGLTNAAAPTFGSAATGSSAGGTGLLAKAGGFIKGLFGRGGNKGTTGDIIRGIMDMGGGAITGATDAAANNRGVQLLAEMEAAKLRNSERDNYERQLISRSEDDRASLGDAFTKSVQAQRVFNSKGYQPGMLSQSPGAAATPLPNLGTGMAAPTDSMKSDAQGLYDEVSKRLMGGSQLPKLEVPDYYKNDPSLLKPGAGERIGNWLGPALTGFSAYNRGISGDDSDEVSRKRR